MHQLGSPKAKLNLKKYKHRQGEKEFPSEVALTFGQKFPTTNFSHAFLIA